MRTIEKLEWNLEGWGKKQFIEIHKMAKSQECQAQRSYYKNHKTI